MLYKILYAIQKCFIVHSKMYTSYMQVLSMKFHTTDTVFEDVGPTASPVTIEK